MLTFIEYRCIRGIFIAPLLLLRRLIRGEVRDHPLISLAITQANGNKQIDAYLSGQTFEAYCDAPHKSITAKYAKRSSEAEDSKYRTPSGARKQSKRKKQVSTIKFEISASKSREK